MREKISKYIHNQWLTWVKTLISTETLSKERVKRWTEECFIPYEELSEKQKDLDRQFADEVLGLLEIKSNSYLNDRKAIDRLKREYKEHGNLIIGFDFDNTIFDYHKEGLELQPVIDLLKKCSDLGFTMCLHSITDRFEFKEKFINELGIKCHFINESQVMHLKHPEYDSKPFYSILLDDRAGLSASYNILLTTLKELDLWDLK